MKGKFLLILSKNVVYTCKGRMVACTYLSSLLIMSICCCRRDAKVCASPPTPLSSEMSLPASLSMSESRPVSNAMATFLRTLACSSFCHSCSFSVNTLLGESSIPERPFVSRLTGSLKFNKLKKFSHGILSYFGSVQNYLYIRGKLKTVVYKDGKIPTR